MKKNTLVFGLVTGFAIGFFVAIMALSVLQSELSYQGSLFRQCYRTEFMLQMYERSLATIFMSC